VGGGCQHRAPTHSLPALERKGFLRGDQSPTEPRAHGRHRRIAPDEESNARTGQAQQGLPPHGTLNVRLKGGRRKKKAIPPATGHAIDLYLGGRTTGPLFATRTGRPLDPKYMWKLARRLATKAGLPHAGTFHPHVLKHDAVTHALDHPQAKLHVVQDFADHKDPRTTRRYDRRKGRLANSPGYGIAARISELLDPDGEEEIA
jgi:integrase